MTPREERRVRTEDDLRAALSTLERHAPGAESVLRAIGQQPARRRLGGRPRTRRLRRPALTAATALTAAAVAALAVTALQPGGRADSTSHAYLADWVIQHHSGGWIRIELRQLKDAAGLQAALRADGVPANVAFSPRPFIPSTGAMARHCQAPDISAQANAYLQGKIFPSGGPFGHNPDTVALVIRASAIPAGIGLFIQAHDSSDFSGNWFDMNTGLVKTSPRCTGTPAVPGPIRGLNVPGSFTRPSHLCPAPVRHARSAVVTPICATTVRGARAEPGQS